MSEDVVALVRALSPATRAELLQDIELVAPTGIAYGVPFDPVGSARCNYDWGSCVCIERYNRVTAGTVCSLVQLEWERAGGPRMLQAGWMGDQFDTGFFKCSSGNTCLPT